MKQTKQTRRKTMKMVTKIAVLASFATIMFAGVDLNWGHSYADNDGSLAATNNFGIAFDVNDATSIGWSDANGMLVGVAAPMDMTMRLGFGGGTSLGVSRAWWSSTGNGWATSLNTSIDFQLTDVAGSADTADCTVENDATTSGGGALACGNAVAATDAGGFKIGVSLGFGF